MPEPPAVAGRGAMPAAPAIAYSPEVAEAICDLTAQGHSLAAICRRRGMPSQSGVFRWLKRRADFAESYALALAAGGGPHKGGEPSHYNLETAVEFCRRLHDAASHGADAFGEFAVNRQGAARPTTARAQGLNWMG